MCHALYEILAESGCVEGHDVIILHKALLAASKKGQHGEHEAHYGKDQRYTDGELHDVVSVAEKRLEIIKKGGSRGSGRNVYNKGGTVKGFLELSDSVGVLFVSLVTVVGTW